jgi:hypothetical protein
VTLYIEPARGSKRLEEPRLYWVEDAHGAPREHAAPEPVRWEIAIDGGRRRPCERFEHGWPVFRIPPGTHQVTLYVSQDVEARRPAGKHRLSFHARLEI